MSVQNWGKNQVAEVILQSCSILEVHHEGVYWYIQNESNATRKANSI
jgi:hypothetical protein